MAKNSSGDGPHFVIVGGGIGGLAVALSLSNAGFRSTVLERADEFTEIGAGIQLGPNSVRALIHLGAWEACKKTVVFPDRLLMRDALTKEEITQVPLGEKFTERFGLPYAVVHRADLLNSLLGECQKSDLITLKTGQSVTVVEQGADSATVRTEDGGTYAGDGVIGCDGLWSTVRPLIVDDGKPLVSGHIAYRAVLPPEEVPEHLRQQSVILWGGPHCHLVHYPLRRGEVWNLVAVFHSDRYEEGWDAFGEKDELDKRFAGTCDDVQTMLGKIDEWKLWVLCDREPVKEWSKGRITLLGDAAHPMLQYLAQGAGMSMEDAVCLAGCLKETGGEVVPAFAKYPTMRYLRTGRVQTMARIYGEFYHAAGVKSELRKMVLSNRSAEATYNGMAWLYDPIPEVPAID
ncbi:MAG: 3-hydroxybenzoate 6-monooxygenase [Rhodospirillales bacterium]|nr:3-hydroxybenzoate 6-monooxygenase [Rhodospirillales bacterium]